MMRGVIVVVVGQEPLVIHVAPDGDDIPWQSVASLRTHFRYAHKNSRTVSHTVHTSGELAKRERSSPCQVRCDTTSSCHPRRFAKGANTHSRGIIGEERQRPVLEELTTARNFPIPNWIFGKTYVVKLKGRNKTRHSLRSKIFHICRTDNSVAIVEIVD